MNSFPTVSLLITHYNRSKSLENLLSSFESLQCEFANIVVSDDGSKNIHYDRVVALQSKYKFTLIDTPVNRGLGHNINKGQDAVSTPYTLYVQEDFEPTSYFPVKLRDSIMYMNDDQDLDIVRFYSYLPYPYVKPYKNDFTEMFYNPFGLKYGKLFYYSDHPHLRRSSFLEKFGRYDEHSKVEQTEYKMCLSFIQKNGKGLFFSDYQKLFLQKNSNEEPSTVKRNPWRRSNNYLIKQIRHLYRHFKYNYDISVSPILRKD